MARLVSAGLLVWRPAPGGPEVLLAHPGGPFWAGRDTAAWSIPKGLVEPDEDPFTAALREFKEELGLVVEGPGTPLSPCKTPGKLILAWMLEADLDVRHIVSQPFEMEWPPRSGRRASFPEVDRAAYFAAAEARMKIHKGQRPILEEALRLLA